MDTELKEKWITALRSGEYKQIQGQLATKDGRYCCLGVLCVIQGIELDETGIRIKEDETVLKSYRRIKSMVNEPNLKVAQMNDNGKNFEEIADYIKENY